MRIVKHDATGELWEVVSSGPPIGPVLRKLKKEEVEEYEKSQLNERRQIQ